MLLLLVIVKRLVFSFLQFLNYRTKYIITPTIQVNAVEFFERLLTYPDVFILHRIENNTGAKQKINAFFIGFFCVKYKNYLFFGFHRLVI